MKKPTKTRLSKAEMRVIVAKDALAQMKAEKYIATNGTYVGSELISRIGIEGGERHPYDGGGSCYINLEEPLQPLLLKDKGECRVCAKGALFLSAVRKFNSAKVGDVADDDDFKIAVKIFGLKQYDLIEAAFEGWDSTKERWDGTEYTGNTSVPAATAFGDQYDGNTERLVAILKNIIKNDGTFKP